MLTRNDPFRSPKRLINRAKKHALKFEEGMQAFYETDPYTIGVDLDPDTGDQVQKVKLVKPMPDDLEEIALEAVNALRSALDQTMFAIGGEGSYFPIAPDAGHLESGIKGRCKNIPVEIVKIICGFKPYRGGNDLLWALNKVRGTNEHAIIAPIAVVVGVMTADVIITRGQVMLGTGSSWDFTKNEMELNRFRPGSTCVQSNFSVQGCIAFYGIPEIGGQPAIAVLYEFIRIVEGVLVAVETEAIRIGAV